MVSILSIALFLITITLVIWQPFGLSVAWPAVLGAAAALMSGVVTWTDVISVTGIVWNATLTFVALIVISLLLDELGFFEWSALHMVRLAGGHGVRLYIFTILLGALVSCFFANDGAALILTPIVLAQVRALKLPAPMVIAFVMASGFIADTTSIPLIISNLVNIVSADFFHISFTEYASVMLLPNAFSLLASLGVLYWYYRKHIPAGYDLSLASPPASAIKNMFMFRMAWLVLLLLLLGYLFSEALRVPVCLIAGIAALLLALFAHRSGIMNVRRVLKEAPWSIVLFSIGMYVVVYGLKNTGFTEWLSAGIDAFSQYGVLAATMGMGLLSAVLSSVMNNLPSVMIGALAIDETITQGTIRETLIYANVIGCDLGPKMTPIGSLATLIWLHILSRKGVRIGWGSYFKTGIVLTVPPLLITLLGLYLRQTLILLE
ncbi:arsenic transporter [Paenibacillus allorhizosphaerae]|uniref:Arsenical pump membrane protein n=1 Tax=Paenibacillus allorhizosphaerae TaxID=2849866 RepID=A0ABN7TIE2_9BACL|nr:arsenic transporter [Paenibacillus allorhizosphaerae]CAG7632108.1 Arsenical pump membrane protein [Paenibacillus allorhizosphaerae]